MDSQTGLPKRLVYQAPGDGPLSLTSCPVGKACYCDGMEQEPELLDDREVSLLYIAKRLKEAIALEEVLTKAGVEYVVEPDTYRGGIIFASERVGAFFYVAPELLPEAREVLRSHRYRPYEEL